MDINEDNSVNISNIQKKNINKDGHDIKKRMEERKEHCSFNNITSRVRIQHKNEGIHTYIHTYIRTYVHTYIRTYVCIYVLM